MNITNLETIFDSITGTMQPIASLVLDAGTQQRAKTDKNAIEGYTENMKQNGVESWEPIQVIQTSNTVTLPDGSELEAGAYVLVNGFQRLDACIGANYDTFPTKVCEGTYEEAIYYSMIANKRNGVSLKGADYQKAIKKLYALDGTWREHGKKKELALLFGCSVKTVTRAVDTIDKEIKQQAFNMFADGKTNNDVMAFAHKALNTIKTWREEYELTLEEKETERENKEREEKAADEAKNDLAYLEMTIGDALKITDKTIQQAILTLLSQSFDTPEPQPEPQGATDEPEQDKPESTGDAMTDLANEWMLLDNYGIHGTTKEKVEKYVNKKAQLNRLHKLALKKCHPDQHGKNVACELLVNAFAELKALYDFK